MKKSLTSVQCAALSQSVAAYIYAAMTAPSRGVNPVHGDNEAEDAMDTVLRAAGQGENEALAELARDMAHAAMREAVNAGLHE